MAKFIPCALILLLLSEILEGSNLFNQLDFGNSKVSNISDISTNEIIIDTTGNVSVLGSSLLKDGQEEIKATLEGNLPQAIKTIAACQQNTQGEINTLDLIWKVPLYAQIVATKEDFFFNSANHGIIDIFWNRLENQAPFCGSDTKEVFIPITNVEPQSSTSKAKPKTNGFRRNGYLKLGNDFYNTDEYCVDKILDTGIVIQYCVATCSETRPCVHKCLPPGDVMGVPNLSRVSSGQFQYSPQFYKYYPTNDSTVLYEGNDLKPHFIQRRPHVDFQCDGLNYYPYSEEVASSLANVSNKAVHSFKFRVQTDGKVFLASLDKYNCPSWKEMPSGKYCVEGIRILDQMKEFTNQENEGIIFACTFPEDRVEVSLPIGIIMIVSSTFLLLTVVVYGVLWHQQNIHGWTIMAHATSMFFAYIFLGVAHIIVVKFPGVVKPAITDTPTVVCYLIGVLAHFFFLSSFSWLSLLSFDLWWTFRSVVPAKKSTGWRIIFYLLIGWGIPGVIVLVSVYLDLSIGNQCTSHKLPKYGKDACYVIKHSLGVYVYYPIAISLVCNLGFFCITLYKLYSYKKNTNTVAKNPNQHQLISLFAKLFFVVGVTWIFEFISWLHIETQITWYWAVIDVINILRAVAIFVIYVCKPEIRESLEKAYPRQCRLILGWWKPTRGRSGGRSAETRSRAQPSCASRENDDKDNMTCTKVSAVNCTP